MALRTALVLPVAFSLRLFEGGAPVVKMSQECVHHPEDLAKSPSFNPAWWAEQKNRPVRVEKDGCDFFHGRGIKCDMEAGEHYLLRKYIPRWATVIEFGARFGTTTCEIAKKLGNSGRLVAVEPDPHVWDDLDANLKSNNCQAHVIYGAVAKQPLHIQGSGSSYSTQTSCARGVEVANYFLRDVEKALGRQVDTMLIDCEGCVMQMLDQVVPALRSTVQTVILERDGYGTDYTEFLKIIDDLGFVEVEKVNDCDKATTGQLEATWCGQGLWHYIWQKKAA